VRHRNVTHQRDRGAGTRGDAIQRDDQWNRHVVHAIATGLNSPRKRPAMN